MTSERHEVVRFERDGLTAMESNSVEESRQMKLCRRVALVAGACMLCFVIVDAMTCKRLEKASSHFVEWVALHPVMGILAVILVYITATICFVPGSILTIGTGYAFGRAFNSTFMAVVLSTTAVFIGASLGSLSCLLLGRYLFRQPVMRLAQRYPVFQAVDRGTFVHPLLRFQSHQPSILTALEGNGFKIMLLLRLSPLVPYNALDYISGVTSISVKHYSMALLGLLPGAFTLCYIGATASSLTEGQSTASNNPGLRTGVLVFGVLFAVAGAAVASYYSKIELDKILSENDTEPSALLESSLDSHEGFDGIESGLSNQLPPVS